MNAPLPIGVDPIALETAERILREDWLGWNKPPTSNQIYSLAWAVQQTVNKWLEGADAEHASEVGT